MKTVNWLLIVGLLTASCGISTRSETSVASATPELAEPALSEEEESVAAWLRSEAIELKTDDPTASDEDLEVLRDVVSDARIVLLGEQTHGTHEFYTMRHRIIRFLVEEMGFDALIVEAPWVPGEAVNDYIHGADLDGWTALANMQYWTFATTEALDMLEWMREYNAGVSQSDQIAFYGMDMQSPGEAIENVVTKLTAVDAEAAIQAESAYACFRNLEAFLTLKSEEQADCAQQARVVIDMIASREPLYPDQRSPAEFENLLQDAQVVVQGFEFVPHYRFADRDRAMAENVTWVLEQSGPDSKIIVWAHNAHIAKKVGRLGGYLEGYYGEDVFAMGMAMYQGSFTAITADVPQRLTEIEAVQAPKYMYEYYLNLVGYPYLLLDLRGVDVSTPGAEWLKGPRGFRLNGWQAGYAELPDRHYVRLSLLEEVDALIFIQDTTPSRPLIMAEE